VSRGEGELLTAPKPRAVSLLSVCLTVKPVGEPDALIGHVRFDERGWETERCRMAQATAPILDSTFSDIPRWRIDVREKSGHRNSTGHAKPADPAAWSYLPDPVPSGFGNLALGDSVRPLRRIRLRSASSKSARSMAALYFPAVDTGEFAQLSNGSVQLTCLKPVFSSSAIDGAACDANAC